jgi:hypothetical protein
MGRGWMYYMAPVWEIDELHGKILLNTGYIPKIDEDPRLGFLSEIGSLVSTHANRTLGLVHVPCVRTRML